MWVQLPPLLFVYYLTHLYQKEKMENEPFIPRLKDMADVYKNLNVSEVLTAIEENADAIMFEPGMDIDELLGRAETIIELAYTVRAHLGIPIPENY
jgi:hypothetical protein